MIRSFFVSILFFLLLSTNCNYLAANDSIVPVSGVFYRMGANTLHAFTYNYGLNFIVSSAGTYGIVQSGLDWHLNRMAYNNKAISNAGIPSAGLGWLVPMVVPAGVYIYGRNHGNVKFQVTGLALTQSIILSSGITSSIKVFTGRKSPGIQEHISDTKDYSNDFKFGFLNRGAFDGWPSSHTATAFAMAVTLMELYPNNKIIKIGALSYASLIGLGVSVNIHWFSDAFAGALIGYAIGKTIGSSFNQMLGNKAKKNYSFYVTPNKIRYVLRF